MSAAANLPAGAWTLDPAATTVTVSVKKLGIFTIPATLTVTSGTIDIDENHTVASVHIVADASSYRSKNDKRNEHVVGADFLDAEAHGTIEFRSSQVVSSGAGFVSEGTVTVKGRTAPIDVTISKVETTDTTGAFVATATVDRNEVGVDRMPAFVIGRELEISVSATAKKST